MVEYMKRFLAEFQQYPYTVEKEKTNWYRITNTYSEFYAIVRPYRGEVYMRDINLDDDAVDMYRWKPVSVARLKDMLGICEPRNDT